MSLRQVDHSLYREYKNDSQLEYFQEHFIKWYEAGGKVKKAGTVWNDRLKKLIANGDRHELCKRQHEVAPNTFYNLYNPMYKVAESTARNIYYQLQ